MVSVVTAPCAISPSDKKAQAKAVGDDLVAHHGKRRFYTVEQVRQANLRQHIGLDVVCWSHAMFNSHEDFDRLHAMAGEACDYVTMKREMLVSVAGPDASGWPDFNLDFDFDLSWLEFPDIDFSIFDFFD